MQPTTILLIAAAACFVLEALEARLGTLPVRHWWALGVAFYLLSVSFPL